MKNLAVILSTFLVMLVIQSCKEERVQPNFEDVEKMSIYDYIINHQDEYSSFLSILEKGHLDKTLSAYNPDGLGYTLFLPNNDAVQRFIEESTSYGSLDEMLKDSAYVYALSRYHVVNLAIDANDFPFGALGEYTLSGDLLTVSFVVETDTAYYKINNQAPVIRQNIETSNGFIHLIGNTLIPVASTTYGWLTKNGDYSIFKEAIDQTGLTGLVNFNLKDPENTKIANTLLIESDSVYNREGIHSFADLALRISPDNQNYTSSTNPLYNYVGYHILTNAWFLDDFVGEATNYSTYSEIPLNINGEGIDIAINKGKQIFDSVIALGDTTIIDYITFYYDDSNVITQSGAIHFINRVMTQQQPTRANQNFEFYGEPLFDYLRPTTGTYLIEDTTAVNNLRWSGGDLLFVSKEDAETNAWGNDYIQISGDFIITYKIPKVVPGIYHIWMSANTYGSENAMISLSIDGVAVKDFDLNIGTNATDTFDNNLDFGLLDIQTYTTHFIEIRSLIPGIFMWDNIRFELP